MRRAFTRALPALVAFAAGVGCGVWQADRRAATADATAAPPVAAAVPVASGKEEDPSSRTTETVASAGVAAKVESLSDDIPDPSPEIAAAHAERRAFRRAVREAKESDRRDFLSSLDVGLLTVEQRERHALFLEALETRDAARREASALRAEGSELPAALQARLSDAEAVLRSDRDAELRALREAAARAAGLDASAVRQLTDDLKSIDGVFSE